MCHDSDPSRKVQEKGRPIRQLLFQEPETFVVTWNLSQSLWRTTEEELSPVGALGVALETSLVEEEAGVHYHSLIEKRELAHAVEGEVHLLGSDGDVAAVVVAGV